MLIIIWRSVNSQTLTSDPKLSHTKWGAHPVGVILSKYLLSKLVLFILEYKLIITIVINIIRGNSPAMLIWLPVSF